MNAQREDIDDELAEVELDAILARVRANIASHVKATANPAGALLAIMAASDRQEHTSHAPLDHQDSGLRYLAPRRLAAVMHVRGRAAEVDQRLREAVGLAGHLASDLDRELNNNLPIAAVAARSFAQQCDRRLIQLLYRARDLVVEIEQELRYVRQLDRDLVLDRDVEVIKELANDISSDEMFNDIRGFDHAKAYIRQSDIDAQIGEARQLSVSLENARRLIVLRESWRNLDMQSARDLAAAIDEMLKRVDNLATALMFRVDALEVDAKSADLSGVIIRHLDLLTGVLWNDGTIWPPEVAQQVGSVSQLVTDGVCQVRPDGQRPAVSFGRHAVDRFPIASHLFE